MRRRAARRTIVGVATLTSLAAISLASAAAVFVAGPAAAAPKTTTGKSEPVPLDAKYVVINATVNAASDHEVVGSSAFPNFSSGAVDNYYSLAHAHIDNSPFAEGRASPADTGPAGQTAAAGNFQQTQYADARWPGDPAKASYGSQGGPYATAAAGEFEATAQASAASSALSAPSPSGTMATPKGFDRRLRLALAAWKAKWLPRLHVKSAKKPTRPATLPAVTVPTPAGPVTTPPVKTPPVTVGGKVAPGMTVPTVTVPSVHAPLLPPPGPTAASSRSLTAWHAPAKSSAKAKSSGGDGATLLASSTEAVLDPKTAAVVTSGESSLGRVSIGGGQIVLEKIHVTAQITNDGDPREKWAITVGSATIGGVPVTIDQDGVHVSGQGQALPYQQASDALNGALKQAGIQIFLVNPEITRTRCGGAGDLGSGSTGSDSGSTGSDTGTTGSDTGTGDSGAGGSCDQMGMGGTGSCGEAGTGTDTTGTGSTTTSPVPTPAPGSTSTSTTSTTTTGSDSSSGESSCGGTTFSGSGACMPGGSGSSTAGGATPSSTTSSEETGTGTDTGTTATTTDDTTGTSGDDSTEETVTATGVHLLFTQPVQQSGVPSQNVEHILGEVFLDSLAVPAGPLPALDFDLGFGPKHGAKSGAKSGSPSGSSFGSGGASGSSCVSGVGAGGTTLRGGGFGSSGGGSGASLSGGVSASPSGFGGSAASAPGSMPAGSAVQGSPAGFVSALKKPLWLLLAYLVWQALVIAAGVSVWRWHKGGVS